MRSIYAENYRPDTIVDWSNQGLTDDLLANRLHQVDSKTETLILADNQLTAVPDLSSYPNLSNLKYLILINNYIQKLSGLPPMLKEIFLGRNSIEKLERRCFHENILPSLQRSLGRSRQLKQPPCEVLRLSLHDIMNYFDQTRQLMSHVK